MNNTMVGNSLGINVKRVMNLLKSTVEGIYLNSTNLMLRLKLLILTVLILKW